MKRTFQNPLANLKMRWQKFRLQALVQQGTQQGSQQRSQLDTQPHSNLPNKVISNLLGNPFLAIASAFYLAMFILGSIRSLEHTLIWTFNDKLLHFAAYSVITVLVYFGMAKQPIGEFFLPRILSSLALVIGLGAFDELAQYFVGRDSSFDDWLVDSAAAVFILGAIAIGHGMLLLAIKLGFYQSSSARSEQG